MADERLKGEMSPQEGILALGGGNPGALHVCTFLMAVSSKVDPDAVPNGWAPLMTLDMLNVWEERIWYLWKDVCGEDSVNMVALLRACQLGIAGVTKPIIDTAIDDHIAWKGLPALVDAVKERLPNFNPAAYEKVSDGEAEGPTGSEEGSPT